MQNIKAVARWPFGRAAHCVTCRHSELRRFILASKWAEDRGCWHHIAGFPNALHCERYEREPGSDDER